MEPNQLPFQHISIQDLTTAFADQPQLMSLMDVCGFFLCQRGTADVSLNDRHYHIRVGDVCFYTPSTFVSLLNRSADLEGIAVKCQLEFILPMLERIMGVRDLLKLRDAPCITLTSLQQEGLELMLSGLRRRQDMMEQLPTNSGSYVVMQQLLLSLAQSIFYELFFDYASNQHLQPQVQDAKDRIFQAFLVSLFKNYKQQREVTFYAEELCLTPRYFSTIIKEKSGHSALQWIIQMVISSVRQKLKSSDLSIKEIAMEYNFPTQSFFGKYFKQYVGVSPKEYRVQVRQLALQQEKAGSY